MGSFSWVGSSNRTGRPSARVDESVCRYWFAAIRSSLSDLPMVEVVDVRPRPTRVLRLAHAELVGWASDSEVIVVEKGRLVGIDVLTKQQRESGIVVRSPADAFVVWR